MLGEVHSIRAQWHRGNLPPPSNDSWKVPLPPGVKQEDMPVNLEAERVKARRALEQSYGSETEGWLKVLGQLEAQIADTDAGAIQRRQQQVQALGYEGKKITDAQGKVVYECTPLEELIRWRLWDRTGAGMMAELGSHQLDAASIFVSALYEEGKPHPHPLRVVAAANRPIFPPDRDIEDHVCCILEFPMPEYDEKDPKTHRTQDLRAICLDQRQRLPELRRAGLRHQGHARPGEGGGPEAPHRQRRRRRHGETAVKVSGGSGGPTLDTQSSGPVRTRRASPAADRSAAVMPRSWSIGPGASAIRARRTSPAALPAWPWPTRSSP